MVHLRFYKKKEQYICLKWCRWYDFFVTYRIGCKFYNLKRLSLECTKNHNIVIRYMEVDKDHIHYMIETMPNINLSNLVRTKKLY